MRTQLVTLAALFSLLFAGCAMDGATEGSDALTSRPDFAIFTGADGQQYFHLRSANHQIVLSSEAYATRTGALGGVLSVLDNGENHARYELRPSSNGQFYFVLKAANNQIIGTSETYTTSASATRGIQAVASAVTGYLDFMANRTGKRFDIFQGSDSRWFFSLHAANGEIVLQSQGYSSEAAAYNGAFSVSENGLDTAHYDVRQASNGGYYFNLVAGNSEIIGTSEVYTTREGAQRGRDAIIALLPTVAVL